MIKLDVREFCHYCPDFEPEVDKVYDYGDHPVAQIVSCENRNRCYLIYRHIVAESKKETKAE